MHPERMYSQLVEKVQLMLDLIEIRHPNVAVSGFHPGGGFNKPIHHKRGHNKSA